MATVTASSTQLSLSLPADLRSWVESRVAAEGYSDAADYVRQLVQRDQDEYEADLHRVRALWKEGLASGVLDEEPEAILEQIISETPATDGHA